MSSNFDLSSLWTSVPLWLILISVVGYFGKAILDRLKSIETRVESIMISLSESKVKIDQLKEYKAESEGNFKNLFRRLEARRRES